MGEVLPPLCRACSRLRAINITTIQVLAIWSEHISIFAGYSVQGTVPFLANHGLDEKENISLSVCVCACVSNSQYKQKFNIASRKSVQQGTCARHLVHGWQ